MVLFINKLLYINLSKTNVTSNPGCWFLFFPSGTLASWAERGLRCWVPNLEWSGSPSKSPPMLALLTFDYRSFGIVSPATRVQPSDENTCFIYFYFEIQKVIFFVSLQIQRKCPFFGRVLARDMCSWCYVSCFRRFSVRIKSVSVERI